MDTETLILTIVTTAFTTVIGLITFYISYRWTVTAKVEKKKSACRDIVSIFLRNLIQDQLVTTPVMLEDLIKSKARDCELDRERFPSLTTFLEDAQSKVLETEFIPHDTKQRILEEIANLRKAIQKPSTTVKIERDYGLLGSVLFAIMGITVGIFMYAYLTTNLIGISGLSSQVIVLAVVIAISFIIVVALALMRRTFIDFI